jgi:putative RecB family exonuclease
MAPAPKTTPVSLRSSLPERLSPSRMTDFLQCPKLFYYKTILKMRTGATEATTKGTLAHYAFEHIFDHPKDERTMDNAVPYVRVHWEELRVQESYAGIVALGEDAVEAMLVEAEQMVRNWFSIEDPRRFDPVGRERWVRGSLGTASMHGIIDRLDRIEHQGQTMWWISDYKTGKAPTDRYLDKAFFAMKIYAVLLYEELDVIVHELRLVYVKNGSREDVKTLRVTKQLIDQTKAQVEAIWKDIVKTATRGEFEAKRGPLCNWCDFQSLCPAFHPELAGIPIDEIVARFEADQGGDGMFQGTLPLS